MFALLCLSADAVGFFLSLAALCFHGGLFFTLGTFSCFSLFTLGPLLSFNALTFCALFCQNRLALSGGRSVNFTLYLFSCFTLGFLFRLTLNLFFAGNALAFGFGCFICAFTVNIFIHQQGHFVVRFELGRQFLIELDVHFQRFGVHRVHGFFGLNALLLGFPFSQRATHFIFQRIETFTDNAAAFVDLLWQSLQLSDQVFTCVVDVGFRARDLMSHGCDGIAAFFRGHIMHQAASLFFDRFNKRVELVVIGENRHRVLFLDDD